MKVVVSRMGKSVSVEVPAGRLYSGESKSGVCRCSHSWDRHHLQRRLEQDREEGQDELFVPAECTECGCAEYEDRGK